MPFQLCRKELKLCLDSCTSTQQSAIEQETSKKNKQPQSINAITSENHQKRTDVYPSSDLGPMDEFRLVRQHAKVQAAYFARPGKQKSSKRLREQTKKADSTCKRIKPKGKKNSKAKRGSEPGKPEGNVRSSIGVGTKTKGAQWTAQVEGVSKGKETEAGPDGNMRNAGTHDEGERMNAMATVDPGIDRDPNCVLHCKATFTCGSSTAPEYSGLGQFLAKLSKNNKKRQGDDAETKSVPSGSTVLDGSWRAVGAIVLACLTSLFV